MMFLDNKSGKSELEIIRPVIINDTCTMNLGQTDKRTVSLLYQAGSGA